MLCVAEKGEDMTELQEVLEVLRHIRVCLIIIMAWVSLAGGIMVGFVFPQLFCGLKKSP